MISKPDHEGEAAPRARLVSTLLCAGSLWWAAGATFAQTPPVRAGTARADITPTLPVTLAG